MVALANLYLKDPAAARFVTGGLAEVETLLGTPLPRLPRPEADDGERLYLVRCHPRLRQLLVKFLQGLLADIGGASTAARTEARAKEQADYEAALLRILRSV